MLSTVDLQDAFRAESVKYGVALSKHFNHPRDSTYIV